MNNLNDNILEMIEKFRQNEDEEFPKILDACNKIINYCIKSIEYTPPITYEDLYDCASVKLYEICKKYKPKGDYKFVSYLVTTLNYELINFVHQEQSMIKFPRTYWIKYSAQNSGKSDTEEGREIVKFMNNTIYQESLNKENDQKEERYSVDCYKIDDSFESEKLNKIFECLDESERKLLLDVYVENESFADIGREMGITREAVRLRFNKILKKIEKIKEGL